jgi:2-polyprenyl-3-methyl-5-hydroxy-6-metoxy-1,4-benzoquinol methylase
MIKTFTDIYDKKKWGGGSGIGSSIKYNTKFIPFLQKLVDNSNNILDLGCGDFNYTTQIDFTNKKYIGLDCVESVINKNNIEFSNSNISFKCCDIFDYTISNEIDLIIIKDVLQHWTNDKIIEFLNKLPKIKIVIVNTKPKTKNLNVERSIDNRYTYSALSLKKYPLNLYNIKHEFNYFYKEVGILN